MGCSENFAEIFLSRYRLMFNNVYVNPRFAILVSVALERLCMYIGYMHTQMFFDD